MIRLQATEPTTKISRFNSLLTLKCQLLFQMTEQSYPSLFTLTIGLIVCNLVCKPVSLVRNWHRQLVLSRDRFSNYLKQHDKETLLLRTASLKFICSYPRGNSDPGVD